MAGRVQRRRGAWCGAAVGVVAALAAVSATGPWWGRTSGGAERVESAGGWSRLEYRDVQVDVPAAWDRRPLEECVPVVEHWGPSTFETCGTRPGVTFLDSMTFDAGSEPGSVVRGHDDGPRWVAHVRLGHVVVAVADDDRAVVRRVVGSATWDQQGLVSTPGAEAASRP